jgi:hypothetical protein
MLVTTLVGSSMVEQTAAVFADPHTVDVVGARVLAMGDE